MSSVPLMSLRHSQNDGIVEDEDESDQHSDNEDPLESVLAKMKYRSQSHSKDFIPSLFFVGFICFVVGFVVSYVTILTMESGCTFFNQLNKKRNANIPSHILNRVNSTLIGINLRYLTSVPHLAGTPQDLKQAEWLQQHFQSSGFDTVKLVPYNVLLSYPQKNMPNKVSIVEGEERDEQIIKVFMGIQPPLASPEESSNDTYPTFNAYSGTGAVKGDLIYANFGTEEDFQILENRGISVQDRIVIARNGKVSQANIANSADRRGAVGLILFSDPQQFAPHGTKDVYPSTVFLPGKAAQMGVVRLQDGDPLTPNFPAIDGMYRIPEAHAVLPRIPIQAIGYADAEELLRQMSNVNAAPQSWKGNLNISYSIGPGFEDRSWKVMLDVRTANKMATTYNVIATMRGSIEPDRYVILGNHRDSWSFGAVDASGGTAAMVELARVFGKLKNDLDWRPRRTLVFCSWGAEEYGLIGSTEWVEEMREVLKHGAVAYLNVDMAVDGNVSLKVQGVPLLYKTLFEATKQVPNPNQTEINQGRNTVYDTWLHASSKLGSVRQPRIKSISSAGDFKPFIHNLGIPSIDFHYSHDLDMSSFPLYHTLYETFHLVSDLMDKGFLYHKAVTELWGLVAWALADSTLIPFDVHDYAGYLNESLRFIQSNYSQILANQNITLHYFAAAVVNFSSAAEAFSKTVESVNVNNPYEIRKLNDQLMMLERAFVSQQNLSDRVNNFNHVVFAPSSVNAYEGTSFGVLTDLILKAVTNPSLWIEVQQHLSQVVYHIQSAVHVLKGDL